MTEEATTCGSCAWAEPDGDHLRCARSAPSGDKGTRVVTSDTPACDGHEAPVDCATCGACCREAFDAVPVEPEDHLSRAALAPLLVVHDDGWTELRRVPIACGSRCTLLDGDGRATPYRCTRYEVRPTACRDLEAGSSNCLLARVRVGLSRP